jgi:hypothetical protein
MMLPMTGTDETNTTPTASPLAITSLVLGVVAVVLALTLPTVNVGFAVAGAAAAIVTGIVSRGPGVWFARVGVLAGIVAGVIGLFALSS